MDKKENQKNCHKQIFYFVLVGIFLYNFCPTFLFSASGGQGINEWFIAFITSLLITWLPVLTIPLIIRFGFNKVLTKKAAITYTVLFSILLLFGNVFLSLISEETITVWNILLMIIPYYILTDSPMFGGAKNKKNTDNIIKSEHNANHTNYKKPDNTFIIDKKLTYIILSIIAICVIYQMFFRYEYKIYQGNHHRAYVVKFDRLTGKATQEYAQYIRK